MLTSILALAPAAPVDPAATEATAQGLVGLLHRLVTAPTTLELLWFALIAVLWTGYLVLEGFDFGVGMLLPIVGKTDRERRTMLSTIGPLWDGNEVWVLTAGGATFAAFPEWYATLFSAAYLPLFLILVGLIIRAVAFEYRGKINGDGWRKLWDWCIILGSWLPSILWGVAFANLVAGVKAAVDPTQLGPSKIVYNGGFFDLVIAHQGFLLLGGLTTAALFLAHGAIFLSLKTDGEVRYQSESLAPKLSIAATVIAAVWVVWLGLKFAGGNHPTVLVWIAIAIAAVALIAVVLTSLGGKFGLAFTSMTVALLAAVVTIFAALFPNVINGSNVALKGDAIADPIVGWIVLGEDSEGNPPDVHDVVAATFAAVEATPGPDLQADPTAYTSDTLTPLILSDTLEGKFPAAGLIPQEDVKMVVAKTFERVGAALETGAITYADVQGEPTEAAVALTAAILADVPAIADGSSDVAAGVIPAGDVITAVKITLARNDLPADDATVGVVVADIVAGGATIAGLPAETVVAEVQKTVQAAIDALPASVQGVLGKVVEVLQAVTDDPATPRFAAGMDLTEIANGKVWDNDLGLANLNDRVDNANGALSALHALGLVTDADGAVIPQDQFKPLEKFENGAVITGQPIHAAASSEKTLQLMTIVAVCLVPIVLAYQAWSIWVFRRRISADRIPAESGLAPAKG
ncbi:MAG: cytochrome d ubiquinol oxidase subunit II [Bifidobacteriaceae bacterium]|jgi:cytochrome d ubiquinol oxidase subunit II|nr:cytochrome d ubiquinol oxidase subunit II [Bifidobacteriaceae bacterium]